uniref:Uncharacterized protein n=1 Tax=Anas platyrhynchos platyrhynchos TaxID=8840 RepID=A0A493T6T8_ANAPP
ATSTYPTRLVITPDGNHMPRKTPTARLHCTKKFRLLAGWLASEMLFIPFELPSQNAGAYLLGA